MTVLNIHTITHFCLADFSMTFVCAVQTNSGVRYKNISLGSAIIHCSRGKNDREFFAFLAIGQMLALSTDQAPPL